MITVYTRSQVFHKDEASSVCLSFGAFTSLAVAEALKRLHNLEPVHIFLSGASAPYVSGSGQGGRRISREDDNRNRSLKSY